MSRGNWETNTTPNIPIPRGIDELLEVESTISKMEAQLLADRDYKGALRMGGGKTGYQPDKYVSGGAGGDGGGYNSTYDPSAIYTRSTNSHDHSVALHIKVAGQVQAAINSLCGLRIWPEYRTPQDYVRNAIVHQLHRDVAAAGLDSIQPTLDMERMLSWIDEKEAAIQRYDAACDKVQGLLERGARIGAWEAVIDTCDMGEALGEAYPEPWATRMRGIVARWRKEAAEAHRE